MIFIWDTTLHRHSIRVRVELSHTDVATEGFCASHQCQLGAKGSGLLKGIRSKGAKIGFCDSY